MKYALLVSLTIVVLPLATGQAQDTPLWRYTTTEKIEFYRLTPLGDLVVGTKDNVVALNPETGAVLWSRDDILKPPGGFIVNPGPFPGAAFDVIPFSPLGIVRTNDGIATIDLATGNTLWDSTAVPLDKVRGHLSVLDHGLVLVYGETAESKRTIVAVDAKAGDVIWRQNTLFQDSPDLAHINSLRSLDGHQPPLVDSDSTFILNISKDGPMRVDARTGQLLWRLDLDKNAPLLREGYAHMLLRDGVLFVPYDKKLLALDVGSGRVIWNRDKNFRSRITQMQLTSAGLVVRGRKPPEEVYAGPERGFVLVGGTDFFVDLVNLEMGASVWRREYKDLKINTPFIVDEHSIFVSTKDEVVALAYADGSDRSMLEFEFEDDEEPLLVEMIGPNVVVSSNQNFLSMDPEGTVQYHRFFEAPGRSALENFALLAVATAVADSGEAIDLDELFTLDSPEELWSRYRDAESWAYFGYIYTKDADAAGREGFSLVKLDKRDGEEVGRVWIDERRPDYVLDWISGFVFVKEGDREIYALAFPDTDTAR